MNVGAVQLYSSGSTVIQGYLASNSLIWRLSASTASWVAPGRSTPTVIVTGFVSAALGAVAGRGAAGGDGRAAGEPQATAGGDMRRHGEAA